MVCLHATDPATVYLSAWARVDGMTVTDLERSLYVERSLVKHLAMRRTLFVFPRETLGVAQAGASNRVAETERRRLIRDVEKAGLHRNGERWLSEAWEQVLAALSDGREATSSELRDEIPVLEGSIAYGEGRSWGGQVPVGPRVLTTLSAAGQIVRASNDGGWVTSRPRWTSMKSWLGEELAPFRKPREWRDWSSSGCASSAPAPPPTSSGGSARPSRPCARRWPISTRSRWISTGRPDTCCATTSTSTEPVEPWAALLPPLDPTTMGWFERDWYLGPYRAQLFDTTGNAGPTVWWDGRIVGGWMQIDSGDVVLQMLEDVGVDGLRALEREAARLTEWLGGIRVLPRFPSPLSKAKATGSEAPGGP